VFGIISNLASMAAQYNLKLANDDAQASIYRLSSGNALYRASDNVAGLSVGTSLESNIVTLKSALTNSAQAVSALGIADGALENIQKIIQLQQSLATQATSSALTSTALGFLDQQFQAYTNQINQIAQTTNFNDINLIDGSTYSPANVTTKSSQTNSVSTQGTITFATASIAALATLAINGVTFTYTATPAAVTEVASGAGTTAANATNLYNAIQNVLNSSDAAQNVNKARLSGLSFSVDGSNLVVASKASGTNYNSAQTNVISITGASFGAAADVTVNGTSAGAATVALSAGGVTGTAGDLAAGTFAAGGTTAYSGTATTIAQGAIKDNILTAINTTAAASGAGYGSGVVANGISNNSSFIGVIQGIQSTYLNPGYVNLSLTVGAQTYTANNVQTAGTSANIVRLSSIDNGGGYLDLTIDSATNTGQTAVQNQAEANLFAVRLNKALSGVSFYQARGISSFTSAGSIFASGTTTQVGNLTGSKMTFYNSKFSNMKIEEVTVSAPPAGGTTATVKMIVDGETYVSGFDQYGAALSGGNIGTGGSTGTSLAVSQYMGLVSTTNPKNMIIFQSGAGVALDLSSTINAQGIQQAFENAFGINSGDSNLSFQVGASIDNTINVQLQSAQVKDIFLDSNGNSQTLSINTNSAATASSLILENALNSITALRATVGSLESRFTYASNNISSTIQNLDAARSVFLDADISSESTSFAQAQVRIQAAVSVLAQSNQSTRNLLKLLP
jgi:flagellin